MKEGDAVGGEGPSPETTLPGSSIRVEVWERRDLHTIEKRLSDLRLRRDKEGVDEGILDMANKILEQLQKLLLEQSEERSLSDGVAAPVLKMHEIEMLKKTALEGVSVLEGRTRGKWPVSRQGGGDVDRPAVPERVWGDWGKSLRNLCLELIVHCKNMLERVT
ncbi:hypothetical protein [Nostoc commune]|nr:hypothetical protein [Nostoc commune]